MVTVAKPCKDCVTAGRNLSRPAPFPGPRCATDHRAFRKASRIKAHDRSVQRGFRLAPGDYKRLYIAQKGRCAGCRRATGKSKRLAVDHDHSCTAGHPPSEGCPLCVRGLVCSTCNQMIGWARDNPAVFFRLGSYLLDPPATYILLG